MADFSRTNANTTNTPFMIRFTERRFDGSPRWYKDDWKRHRQSPATELDREPKVNKLIEKAHDGTHNVTPDGPFSMLTCTNPDCPLRLWTIYSFASGARWPHGSEIYNDELETDITEERLTSPEERESIIQDVHVARRAMVSGRRSEMPDGCNTCGKRYALFSIVPINNKWVYVLKESGDGLEPYAEVHITKERKGTIYKRLEKGRFTGKGQKFNEGLILPDVTDRTWHFFLSPIRLGASALALLCKSPRQDISLASERAAAKPGESQLGVMADLQPWSTTVKRKFGAKQVQQAFEFIPLVDPFSWAAEVAERDYRPVLEAQYALARDPNEQRKAFIAATLAQAVGRKKVLDEPPTWAEDDRWDLKDEFYPPPKQFEKSKNMPQAWIDRYTLAFDYLSKEADDACSRLVFILRYSLAHRIVEMAAQENAGKNLIFGLAHWLHMLKGLLGCPKGRAFTVWLASSTAARERIPARNVMAGKGIDDEFRKEFGIGLPLNILACLGPAIIAKSVNPAEDLAQHLKKFEINVETTGSVDLLSAADFSAEIAADRIAHYVESLPDDLAGDGILAVSARLKWWQERLELYGKVREIEDFWGVLMSLRAASHSRSETELSVITAAGARARAPFKIAGFVINKSQQYIRSKATGELVTVIDKLKTTGLKSLTQSELEILHASRVVNCFKLLQTVSQVLSGPVAVVFGGFTIVTSSGKAIDAWEAGDHGAALAQGIDGAAAVLTLAVAGAHCAALISGSAVAAWAGPVGLIAAGLMLLGAAVMAWCSKNDLEMFASHCFLGRLYGTGDWGDKTGKMWMTTKPWPWLRYTYHKKKKKEAPDRFERQQVALLRMISGFTVWTGFTQTEPGCFIYPGNVPPNASFDVIVEVGDANKAEAYMARVWPNSPDGNDFIWLNKKPGLDSNIDVVKDSNGRVENIEVKVDPKRIQRAAFAPLNYEVKIRLDLDGRKKNYLPVGGWVEIKSGGLTRTVDSVEVD
jgi:hypothetical protein